MTINVNGLHNIYIYTVAINVFCLLFMLLLFKNCRCGKIVGNMLDTQKFIIYLRVNMSLSDNPILHYKLPELLYIEKT